MRLILIILTFFLIGQSYSQTDEDIAKTLLGTSAPKIESTLDSMGVWHNLNYYSEYNLDLSISIENENGSLKVYMVYFKYDSNRKRNAYRTIDKVIINYRHDNKQHLSDLKNISGYEDKHEGKYSTDVTFKN